MAYTKQTWENLPSTNTPITADRLNHMEDGIYNAYEINNNYSTSETKGYSSNYINNNFAPISDEPIIVKETSFTISGSGTGWKTGNFAYSEITGYKLVAVTTRTLPSGDVNQFMFNIYSDRIFYRAYMGYDNYGDINVNLIYVKTDNIS